MPMGGKLVVGGKLNAEGKRASEGDFTANFKADNDLAGTGEIGIKIAINEDERYLASIVFWKGSAI